ncbi:sulfite exporter TauE/SafE family protein [Oceanospirillum beijerinckii]|uniref:sulfite exporter TauE/SafE family protein n=1 Tax=Oceanospirillum beijerinckii TaxID=64976 RepID=UPI000419B3B4|nr:sulfite exporter TauE/SafE family protein [Oceanospirillum beijerinckii]MAC46630.1 sulfite exporter TauE/SafE family protein [Oceanospirillum sp.]
MDLSAFDLALLTLTSGFTSLMTASVGIGGGVLLLAVMASILPANVLIPVHGLVQLGSNGNRAFMTRQHIHWPMVLFFSLGALVGALSASQVLVQLPLDVIRLAVAVFILLMVWGPKPKKLQVSGPGTLIAGCITTFASMFVGASGPLVAAVVHRSGQEKLATTATFAACMSFQHLLKAMVFGFVGFSFAQWWWPVLLMIASGAVGTWLGLKLLNRLPAELFAQLFKVLVTLLALRLLWQAWGAV